MIYYKLDYNIGSLRHKRKYSQIVKSAEKKFIQCMQIIEQRMIL